ncbi:MAG: hypothetical protein R2706_09930 [Acidimicrobiales bacterium]
MAFEFVDREVDSRETIRCRHLGPDVVAVSLHRDFAKFLVAADPRILLFPEMNLGTIHATNDAIEMANLLGGLSLE